MAGACVCAIGLSVSIGPTAGARSAAGGGEVAAASADMRVATRVAEHRYRTGYGLVASPWQPPYLSSQFTPSWRGAYGGYTILDGTRKMKTATGGLAQQAQSVVFRTPFITVHGIHYGIPARYRDEFLLVLPLRTGIVWIPVDRRDGGQPLPGNAQAFAFRHPLTFPIYVTPYRTAGGSLLEKARVIAILPQKWLGAAQARAATAWTGWLPQGGVARAHLGPLTSEAMTFHVGIGYLHVATVQPLGGRIPVWPDYFGATVGQIARHQTPLAAWPGSITKTQGGFVLSVSLRWAPSGANAGMTGANYYYSMRTGKWTPLNQIYMVQTLTGTLDVGSRAVFWQQPLGTSGNQLAVPQLWFDPKTDSIHSVWIGNWVNGPSYIDGGTLLFQSMSSGTKPSSTWMTYSPPGRPMSLYESTVTLPDGRVVTDGGGTPPLTWEGMSVSLQAQGAYGPSVMRGLIGNQADVLKTSAVLLPVGQAYAAVVRRTSPAAAGSTPPRYEYWLAVLRPDPLHPGKKVAYCLVGVSRTNQPADLANLETLAAAWTVPTSQEAR